MTMTHSFRRLAASLLLTSTLLLPALPSLAADGYVDDSNTQGTHQNQPVVPQPNPQPVPNPVQPNTGDGQILPQIDTSDRGHDPLIDINENENVGEFLKGQHVDQEQLGAGFSAASPIVAWTSWVVGWTLAILVGTIAFFNVMGLAYIAIPFGFLRYLLSGGASNNPGGSANGGQGSMGGYGAGGYGAPAQSAQGTHSSSWISHFRLVPTAAIQAVALSETGGLPGGNHGHNTNLNFNPGGGPNVNVNAGNNSSSVVNPYTFYLKQQAVAMVALGVSIVVLVLSSVLFNTGINLGNAAVQLIEWIMSYIVG